jgi:hypothetical protein
MTQPVMCSSAHFCRGKSCRGPKYVSQSHIGKLTFIYTTNIVLAEGGWLESKRSMDADTVALAWLVSALEQARSQGQTKVVDYLETIADDVVFEMEMAARRASLRSRAM